MADLKSYDRSHFSLGLAKGLFVCIAQLRRSAEEIGVDAPARDNVAFLCDFLTSNLRDTPRGRVEATLVLCPEYAFSADDWQILDQTIREFPRPLILAAGFGASESRCVDAIAGNSHVTTAWPKTSKLPPGYRYNFGALWVHCKESSDCFLFGKNRPAPEETRLNPHRFTEHLRVNLADTVIWPFICADLLTEGEENGQRANMRNGALESSKDSLFLGLLYQHGRQSNLNWRDALRSLAKTRNDGSTVALVANAAQSHIDVESDARNLTGAYASFGIAPVPGNANVISFQHVDVVSSWLIRSGEPLMVTGLLNTSTHAALGALCHLEEQTTYQPGPAGCRIDDRKFGEHDLYAALGAVCAPVEECRLSPLRSYIQRSLMVDGKQQILKEISVGWIRGPLATLQYESPIDDPRRLKRYTQCLKALGGLLNLPKKHLHPPLFTLDINASSSTPTQNFCLRVGTFEDNDVWLWSSNLTAARALQRLHQAVEADQQLQIRRSLLIGEGTDGDFSREHLEVAQVTSANGNESLRYADLATDTPRSRLNNICVVGMSNASRLWKNIVTLNEAEDHKVNSYAFEKSCRQP